MVTVKPFGHINCFHTGGSEIYFTENGPDVDISTMIVNLCGCVVSLVSALFNWVALAMYDPVWEMGQAEAEFIVYVVKMEH